ncbi:MAG TPA: hydroxyacid dehydrogenase [Opitutaceae bacterium]
METLAGPSASALRASASPAITERVLFALNEHECATFFPGTPPATLAGAEIRWRPAGALTPAAWLALLEEFQPTVLVSCWSTPSLPPSFATADSPLRYVCHLVGSARNLVPRGFLERGGLLTNWGPLAGGTVAEHALLLALAALRRQPAWRAVINQPVTPWVSGTDRLQTRTLIGRRVGIHGFGHVARSLVRLLQPFDVEVAAYSAGVPSAFMQELGVRPCASLRELAAGAEVFFECEALNPQTTASVDGTVLAALPDGALFVNVGRGRVVDEAALLREAESGRIHVALDVVTEEPLVPESRAAGLPDVVLSPHIAGPTWDRFPDCGRLALANLGRYLRGEPLEALITPEIYDRAT